MNTTTLQLALQFTRSASMAATIQGHGSKADFLATRIVQASTETSLQAMAERLSKLLGTDAGKMPSSAVAGLMQASAAPDAADVLAWLRAYPKLAAMVCFLPQDEFVETAAVLATDVATATSDDVAPERPGFDYQLTCHLTAPLAHGADVKAGNATLFRRQMVCGVNGGVMQLPFYAGNALRGLLRDILADELTALLGLAVSRAKPVYNLWFFHSLYAGGALEDSTQTKAVDAKLGKSGALRGDGVREFRDLLPSLSLLGCAVGNKIISGRIRVGDLRPRCKEWGTGDAAAESLFDWLYLTRRDDHEGRTATDDHKGMIANTEVLRPGVVLDGGIDVDAHTQPLERAALVYALEVLQRRGYLGAQSRQGYGQCIVDIASQAEAIEQPWYVWVVENRAKILEYLCDINAIAKQQELAIEPTGEF